MLDGVWVLWKKTGGGFIFIISTVIQDAWVLNDCGNNDKDTQTRDKLVKVLFDERIYLID